MRRLLIRASEWTGRGLWANLACRKRFIGDKLDEALDDIDAVVILGAGLDTRAYRLTRRVRIPVFEVDLPVNIARKAKTVRRVLGELPLSVRLVALDFERDDLLTALAEHGYRLDYRVFFIWEGVTQYLTEDAVRRTLEGLRAAAPGSRLVFTYVRRDFIDGTNRYGSPTLYRTVRKRRQLWHFGLQPDEVAGLHRRVRLAAGRAGRARRAGAALRRAHRPQTRGLAAGMVGLRGEDLRTLAIRSPWARSSAAGDRFRPPTCRRCGAPPGRSGSDR